MARSRERVLDDYLNELTKWGLTTAVKLWSQVDVADVKGTWAEISPAVMAAHEGLVTAALNAVDDYMTMKAGDRGFRYDVTWRQDRPNRPREVYWGAESSKGLGSAPIRVLWGIKHGKSPEVAMALGANQLLRIFGTEAHQIGRTVTLERVLASR